MKNQLQNIAINDRKIIFVMLLTLGLNMNISSQWQSLIGIYKDFL
tara:strand:+ start:430 stop:564 length:135 start_codon:yes stop_codon:yes gene_type:complete